MKMPWLAALSIALLAAPVHAQDDQNAAQPSSPAPNQNPPLPPDQPPPPPSVTQAPENTAPQSQPAPSGGQWVYTAEYGWLWLPYGSQYVYAPPYDGAYPYSYAYYPLHGWLWLYSPWVWGWGIRPYYGWYGPRHYVWYGRPGVYFSWGLRGGWGPGFYPGYRYAPGWRGGGIYHGGIYHGGSAVGGGYHRAGGGFGRHR